MPKLFTRIRALLLALVLCLMPAFTLTACASGPDLQPTVKGMTETLKDIRFVFDEAKLQLNEDKAKNKALIEALRFRVDMAIKNGETATGGKDDLSCLITKRREYALISTGFCIHTNQAGRDRLPYLTDQFQALSTQYQDTLVMDSKSRYFLQDQGSQAQLKLCGNGLKTMVWANRILNALSFLKRSRPLLFTLTTGVTTFQGNSPHANLSMVLFLGISETFYLEDESALPS